MTTKALIFDLDFCIFDTRSLGDHVLDPVLAPLFASQLSSETKQIIADTLWSTSLEDTIALFDIDPALAGAMRTAHQTLIVPNDACSYGDEYILRGLPVYRALVTTGYKAWQEAKIAKIAVESLFDEIIIDTIDDLLVRKGKQRIFEELLVSHGWQPSEVFVIGDNPHSELKAARALQIPTIQTLRPTIKKDPLANYHITSFAELPPIVNNS